MPIGRLLNIGKFTRGLNTAKRPKDLLPGEFSRLVNYFPLAGQLRYRPGMVGWHTRTAMADIDVTGLQTIAETTPGQWDLIVLSRTSLINTTFGGNSTALTDSMSLAFGTSTNVWQSTQYKNYGYAVRPGLNYILRFNDTAYWSNGIAAPSTAAAIADGGVGTGEAGTFYGVFTFVDADGVESDYSPVSNAITVAANRYFAWSSVDVSTNPRVVARNLYRTLPNQTGEYFYVTQIADNTTTTANEAILTAQMGDLAPVGHTVPPTVAYVDIETAFERLWATDGAYVYGSLPEDPDSFDPTYTYAFSPDDGEPIKALKRLGPNLMVVKSGSVHALNQSLGAFEFLPRLVDEANGTISTRSVAVGDGKMFWYSGKAVFVTDGNSPGRDLSTGRIAELSEFSSTDAANTVGVFYEQMGWYVLSTPGGIYVYDSRRDTWFTAQYPRGFGTASSQKGVINGGFNVMKSYIDANGLSGVYAGGVSGTTPYPVVHDVFPPAYTDGSTGAGDTGGETGYYYGTYTAGVISTYAQIEAIVKFPGADFGAPGRLHVPVYFLLATDNPAQAVIVEANRTLLTTVNLYLDESAIATKTRTSLVVVGSHVWKRFGLDGGQRKAHVSEVEIIRRANYELIISGFQLYGEVWNQEPRELT